MDKKIDKKIDKVLTILSISEYKIIGSKADPNINDEVISDIDTQDIEREKIKYEDILKHFQEVFETLKKSSNIIITDFKCGYNIKTEEPYRWNYKNIMKGFQYDNKNKIYFIDELKKKSTIKIDTIIYINNDIIELTMNYYFKDNYNKKSKKEIIKELKEDINKYKKEGNYYKALKRLNSINKLIGKKNKKLLDIINSEYGIMAKDKSRLETLLFLMKNFPTKFNLTEIKKKYKVKTKKDIQNLIDNLNTMINNSYLKTFLNNLI